MNIHPEQRKDREKESMINLEELQEYPHPHLFEETFPGSISLLHKTTAGCQVLSCTCVMVFTTQFFLTRLCLLRTIETKDFAPHMIGLVLKRPH